jgi:pullulanase/glycogen debranching enzyme
MNNEVERYVGELRDLRRVNHTTLKHKETLEQWITWLDADIRHGQFADWQKEKRKELKTILEEMLMAHKMVHTDENLVRVSGVPYEVELERVI